jgi:hypothetical protein
MTQFNWKFKQILTTNGELTHVEYLLTGTEGEYSVETEGTHTFKDGTVDKLFEEIGESDIRGWIEKDTTQGEVNILKLTLENQINYLKNAPKKADLPWLANTFTIE